MGWEAIAPAAVVVILAKYLWDQINKRIDSKAEDTVLQAHIKAWEISNSRYESELRRMQDRLDREVLQLNARYEKQNEEMRRDINGMSVRIDERFNQVVTLLNSRHNDT